MDFTDRWDIAIGIVSLVVVPPMLVRFANAQLPSKKLRYVFDLLDESDALLVSCCEEGLIKDDQAGEFRTNLSNIRSKAEHVKLEVNIAKSYFEDLANIAKGLTRKINTMCAKVRKVRAEISTVSVHERERLAGNHVEEETAMLEGSSGDAPSALPVMTTSTTLNSQDPSDAPVTSVSDDPTEISLATLQHHGAQTHSDLVSVSDFPVTGSPTHEPAFVQPVALSTIPILIKSVPVKRLSACSSSSGASSAQSFRCKKSISPLSRARSFARFIRKERAQRSSLYLIGLQELSAIHVVEDEDEDWVDELRIRVVV